MKVRLNKNVTVGNKARIKGDVIELDDAVARNLIEDGHAEKFVPEPEKKPEPEEKKK